MLSTSGVANSVNACWRFGKRAFKRPAARQYRIAKLLHIVTFESLNFTFIFWRVIIMHYHGAIASIDFSVRVLVRHYEEKGIPALFSPMSMEIHVKICFVGISKFSFAFYIELRIDFTYLIGFTLNWPSMPVYSVCSTIWLTDLYSFLFK